MKLAQFVLLTAFGALVSACSTTDVATRNAPFEPAAYSESGDQALDGTMSTAQPDLRVENVSVEVPSNLSVSEANLYLPRADIVWRGDAIGDRHRQVKAIFDTAMERGVDDVQGTRPVNVDIKVMRFHALTEKARYSVGGVHNIIFLLTIRDASTGEIIAGPREVRADLEAYGGDEAIQADARGDTQKVRITAHLADVIRQELTEVDGFQNPNLGVIQAMHSGI